jgi:predicted PolB exonuclease-like 3'-5' exonuclease
LRYVTFNGLQFDIPFLAVFFAQAGMNARIPWDRLMSRYNNEFHFDIYNELTGRGTFEGGTLTDWAVRFGTPVPKGRGYEVAWWAENGHTDKIREHCESNVAATRALYLRVAGAWGQD